MTKLETVAEAVATAYNNNKSLKEIAAVYDCSVGTVRNLLISKGISRRPKGRKKTVK